MLQKFNQITHKFVSYVLENNFYLFLFLFLASVYVCFFGAPLMDAGTMISYFKLFPEYYKSINYSYAFFLTVLAGSVIYNLIGKFAGVITFKIFASIINAITIIIVKKIYDLIGNKTSGKVYLFFTLCLSSFIAYPTLTINVLSYDSLTAFFYLLGSLFLIESLPYLNLKKGKILLFLSGLILGFNIFIRLPNISGLAIVPITYFFIRKKKSLANNYLIIWQLLGIVISIFTVMIIMKQIGYIDHYLLQIRNIFSSNLMDSPLPINHPFKQLFFTLLWNLFECLCLGIAAIIALNYFKKRSIVFASFLIFLILIFNALYFHEDINPLINFDVWTNFTRINKAIVYTQIGLLLITNTLIYFSTSNYQTKLISIIASVLIILVPAGSDIGILKSNTVLSLSWILLIANRSKLSLFNLRINMQKKYVFVLSFLFLNFYLCFTDIFLDSTNKFYMTEKFETKDLRFIKTTPENKKTIDSTIKIINEGTSDSLELITLRETYLYYFTNKRPYLNEIALIFNSPEQINLWLNKKIQLSTNDDLGPIIVLSKIDLSNERFRIITNLLHAKFCYNTIIVYSNFIYLPQKCT
jgi:hypothetical protein